LKKPEGKKVERTRENRQEGGNGRLGKSEGHRGNIENIQRTGVAQPKKTGRGKRGERQGWILIRLKFGRKNRVS